MFAWVTENRALLSAFTLTTAFNLIQHSYGVHWDFAAYLLTGRAYLGKSIYAESSRAPLPSLLFGISSLLGQAGEYLSILFICTLFLYASVRLSDLLHERLLFPFNLSVSRLVFYVLLASPSVLKYGTEQGSELFSLAVFMLFLVRWFNGKANGHWFALTVLTRYNFILFLPLLFFQSNLKKIILSLLSFIIVCTPWLLFCYYAFGHPLQSIVGLSGAAMVLQEYLRVPLRPSHVVECIGVQMPLCLLGILTALRNGISRKRKEVGIPIFFLLLAAASLHQYVQIPQKMGRYLINLALPSAVFSAIGMAQLRRSRWRIFHSPNALGALLMICLSLNFLYSISEFGSNSKTTELYRSSVRDVLELGIGNCAVASMHWVPIAYYLGHAEPIVPSFSEKIAEGRAVIIFPSMQTVDDKGSLDDFGSATLLKRTEGYSIYGKEGFSASNCAKAQAFTLKLIPDICLFLSERFTRKSVAKAVFDSCEYFRRP